MRSRRPFLLWLVCLLFLVGALTQLLKAIEAITSWNVLFAVQYQPGPIYPLFFGVFFSLLFLASSVLLWLRLRWAPGFGASTALLFSTWYWLDKFVIAVNPQPITGEVFNLIVYFVILGLILASMWALGPSMREDEDETAEGGSNERESS
jgi:hypothetical protein